MSAWLIFMVGLVISATVIAAMLRSGRVGAIDMPNERSLHAQAVPRSGGLGVLAALASGFMLAGAGLWMLVVPLSAVALVSWLDDHHNLPARVRFIVQVAAAGALPAFGLLPGGGLPWVALVVFGVVWLTNLYNFMDGANGLAGGMAVIGFGALGVAAAQAGSPIAGPALAAAGGALGFLFFNFHPARIFMGDVGSIPLGFLAGALGLVGAHDGLWPLPFLLLVFSPFMVDATLTLLKRALRGERVWQAHREHYYQRLVQSGWSHRRVACCYYVLMLSASISGLMLINQPIAAWWVALAVWALIYAGLAMAIDLIWKAHTRMKKT